MARVSATAIVSRRSGYTGGGQIFGGANVRTPIHERRYGLAKRIFLRPDARSVGVVALASMASSGFTMSFLGVTARFTAHRVNASTQSRTANQRKKPTILLTAQRSPLSFGKCNAAEQNPACPQTAAFVAVTKCRSIY